MKKTTLLTLAVVCGSAWSSYAQTTTTNSTTPTSSPANRAHFSFGIDAGATFNEIRSFSHTIIGGSLKYEVPFSANTLFTVSAGYSNMIFTNQHRNIILAGDGVDQKSAGFIPIKAGVKHYIDSHFFVEGQAGAAISLETNNPHNHFNTAFLYSGGIGYTLHSGLEVGVRYEDWAKNGNISQVALSMAYRFR